MIAYKIILLTQFIITEFVPYSNSKLTELSEDINNVNVLRGVEDLLEVVIEENIPKKESITFYYDEEWQRSGLKPGEILSQKSARYHTWKLLTYHDSDRVDKGVFGKQVGEKRRSNTVHENVIVYYNYTQCFVKRFSLALNSMTIKNKAIIYIDGITHHDMFAPWKNTELCKGLIEMLMHKLKKSIFIMRRDYSDTLEIARINVRKLPNCAPAISVPSIALWNIRAGQKSEWTNDLFNQTPYYCEYPLLEYISHGDTECLINSHDFKGESTTPIGACMEMIHSILQKIFFVNNTVCQRMSANLLQTGILDNVAIDIYINDGSTEYMDIPSLVISSYIGFENVSVILINPPTTDGFNGNFTSINTNVVLGVLILALAMLVAFQIISRYWILDQFDSSIFVIFTWATTLGFSVPNQPTGKFRIVFIAFVIFSFFLVTLYSQHMYTKLTVQQETDILTLQDLQNRNVTKIVENVFHECYNTKAYDADENKKCSMGKEMQFVITNKNHLSLMREDVTYKVLPEFFIRPKFLYWAKSMPVDLINILILRATQAGLDQKWKSHYQQKLLETNEKFDDVDEDVDTDSDENDDEGDFIKPVFVIDLYGPLILIYSLLACSALVLIVEILVDKIRKRIHKVGCIQSSSVQQRTEMTV